MLILVLLSIISILWLWSRISRSKDEPPLANGSKILIGHALLFAGNSIQLWRTAKKLTKEALERGGVLKTTIGPKTLYVLINPEDCLTVSNICLKKDALYDFSKPWIGNGLLLSSPSQWKVQRKLLSPAFGQQVLDNFLNVFNDQSRCLVNNLKVEVGKGPFDHLSYTKYNSLETVCLTIMGVDLKEKSTDNAKYVAALAENLNILVTRFQTFWLHNNFLFSLSRLKRKQDACIKILHDMGNKGYYKEYKLKSYIINCKWIISGLSIVNIVISFIISIGYKKHPQNVRFHFDIRQVLRQRKEGVANVKSEEETQGRKFQPFIELILELSRDTNIFTDREIREHVDTMIMAGHDSLSMVLMFCMLFVGSKPHVQEKIHEELKTIFGGEDRDVTKQDLSQLVYLEAVIKETMRICPSTPIVVRHLDKDVKLQNCTLYKGNSAFLFIYGMHRHSMWGPDAEEFKPDRWLDTNTLPDCSYAIGSFGVGRRNCIAQNYAMMSMKVTLSHICRNYIIHSDDTKLEMKLDVVLKPISGHHISIENRH